MTAPTTKPGAAMKKPSRNRKPKEAKPITAQPVGASAGYAHYGTSVKPATRGVGYVAEGCYRKMPTNKE